MTHLYSHQHQNQLKKRKRKVQAVLFRWKKRKVVFEDEADKEGLNSKIIEWLENMDDDLGYQMVVVRRGGGSKCYFLVHINKQKVHNTLWVE